MKIWFQNRRTKWKKQENITNEEAAEHKIGGKRYEKKYLSGMDSSNSSFTTNNNSFNGIGAPMRHSSSFDDQPRIHCGGLGINLFGNGTGNMEIYSNLNHTDRDGMDDINSENNSCFSHDADPDLVFHESNQNIYENVSNNNNNNEDDDLAELEAKRDQKIFHNYELKLEKPGNAEEFVHSENEEKCCEKNVCNGRISSSSKSNSLSDTELSIDSEKKAKLKQYLDSGSNSN